MYICERTPVVDEVLQVAHPVLSASMPIKELYYEQLWVMCLFEQNATWWFEIMAVTTRRCASYISHKTSKFIFLNAYGYFNICRWIIRSKASSGAVDLAHRIGLRLQVCYLTISISGRYPKVHCVQDKKYSAKRKTNKTRMRFDMTSWFP